MNTKLLTIFTRTPLHIGAGSSVGVVDLPVVRERHTGYPVIPGSAIKGVLADLWLKRNPDGSIFFKETKKKVEQDNGEKKEKIIYESVRDEEGIKILGNTDNKNASAGSLLIGEGKLLAFPVRSAKGGYALVTCPLALNRFKRDCADAVQMKLPDCDEDSAAVFVTTVSCLVFEEGKVVFESYVFDAKKDTDTDGVAAKLLALMPNDCVWKDVVKRLAIVSNTTFARFVVDTCEIAQHNRINDFTGVVDDGALFSQENVPSETMFYSVFNELKDGCIKAVEEKLKSNKVNELLQIGADITTGLGWCSVGFCGKEA